MATVNNVIVDRILARHAGSLNTPPKMFAAVPEQDQLAEVFGVAQRRSDGFRQCINGENVLPIQAGLIK